MGMLLRRHRKARGLEPEAEQEAAEPDLSEMTKAELVGLATERGLDVIRRDGEDGAPLKADYLAALQGAESAPATEGGEGEEDEEPPEDEDEGEADEQEAAEGGA